MSIFEVIKNIFVGETEDSKKSKLLRNIIILGMIGTFLLLFSSVFSINNKQPSTLQPTEVKQAVSTVSNEEKLAGELEEIISLIKGVGRVKVKVYAEIDTQYEYEFNQNTLNKVTNETDQNGGKRQIDEKSIKDELIIIKDAAGNENPVIKKKTTPKISGVLIVAEGAEVSSIKYQVVRAVSSLLNLPVHKISVLPYERR